MEDVVEAGNGSRRGWGIAAALAAGALLAGMAVTRDDEGTPGASPSPSPPPSSVAAASPSARATVTFSSTVGGEPVPIASGPSLPPAATAPAALVTAPRWSGPHDPLIVASQSITVRVRDGGIYQLAYAESRRPWTFAVAGGTVLVASDGGDFAARKDDVFYVPRGGAAIHLGGAHAAAPTRDAGSVWLVDYTRRGDTYAGTARRVDLRGGAVRGRVGLPAGAELTGEVRGGFLTNPLSGEPHGSVWNPATKAFETFYDGPVHYGTATLAVAVREQGCEVGCVAVANLATGRVEQLRGLDHSPRPPVLSPDGRYVAAFVPVDTLTSELHVVDVASREVTFVGRTRVATATETVLAWSRDSRTLYAGLRSGGTGQVLAWRQGTKDVAVLLDGEAPYALSAE